MAVIEQRVEVVEGRVDRLEDQLGQFMTQTAIILRRLDRTIERLATEAALDRQENARDREENARAREEEARARERAREEAARAREEDARAREKAREEAAEKEEDTRAREKAREVADRDREEARAREKAREASEEAARERREMNKRWGELANKMGTIVEDIVAPSLRRMAVAEFDCGEERFFAERISRTRSDDPSLRREFDALCVGERAVLLNETKSTAHAEDVRAFVAFLRSGEFALYFPEFRTLPVTPVFSSLQLSADLVTYLTRNGIYAVAMGDEAMQVLNLAQVRAKAQ